VHGSKDIFKTIVSNPVFWGLILVFSASGCRMDMHDQPKYEIYETSSHFSNGQASRIPPPGTVAQGQFVEDVLLYTGKDESGADSDLFPFPIDSDFISRGKEQFNVFCSPCHDKAGTGRGMIVRRGMKRPPSLHITRLREAPPGYIFNVITNGYGVMFSYSSRVTPEDRWAIIAYIRALQLSQGATLGDVTQEDVNQLENLD